MKKQTKKKRGPSKAEQDAAARRLLAQECEDLFATEDERKRRVTDDAMALIEIETKARQVDVELQALRHRFTQRIEESNKDSQRAAALWSCLSNEEQFAINERRKAAGVPRLITRTRLESLVYEAKTENARLADVRRLDDQD